MSDDLTPESVSLMVFSLRDFAEVQNFGLPDAAADMIADLSARVAELEAERDAAMKFVDDNWITHQQVIADRARAEAAEAALATAIRDLWAYCEELEDEAYAKLPTVATDHEKGFWAAQKMTAKRIRRATTMPATLIPNEQPNE